MVRNTYCVISCIVVIFLIAAVPVEASEQQVPLIEIEALPAHIIGGIGSMLPDKGLAHLVVASKKFKSILLQELQKRGRLAKYWAQDDMPKRIFVKHGLSASVAFSPQGELLATGAVDHDAVHLWDIRTGEEIDRFGWDIKGVQALFFSHDNQMLVAKCLDNKIRVWELKTGRQIKEFQDNNWAPGAITLCSDGVTLASGSQEGTISLWNIITGLLKGVIKTHLYGLWCLASSPNSNILASGSWAEHGVRLWDVETGKQVQEFTGPIRGVRSVAISRDDQTLAAGFSDDTISLWNMKTGERMHVVQGYFLGVPAPLAFCPDGRLIVGGSQYKGGKCDNRMPLCKVQTGKQIQELHAEIDRGRWHDGMINSIAFSSDGKTLAVGCHNGDVHLWGTGACQ